MALDRSMMTVSVLLSLSMPRAVLWHALSSLLPSTWSQAPLPRRATITGADDEPDDRGTSEPSITGTVFCGHASALATSDTLKLNASSPGSGIAAESAQPPDSSAAEGHASRV